MKINYAALLTKIAGGALAGLAPLLGSLFPKQQLIWTTVFGSTGFLVLIAGLVLQSIQPANKITEDAVVVSPSGATVGTNVSTTSTEPINAPYQQKGT